MRDLAGAPSTGVRKAEGSFLRWSPYLLGCALVCVGVLGILARGGGGLAGDEMWGAMHPNLSLAESLVFTLRYDLHPPLYYFQLVLWSLPLRGDFWLLLNSVAWTALAAAMFFARFKNSVSPLQLTALVLSMVFTPLLAEYSIELRMYSMLACLSLAAFLSAERCVEGDPQRRGNWWLYAAVNLIAIYTHAAGFLVTLCAGSWLILQLARTDQLFRSLYTNAALAIASAPVFLLSLAKSVSHTTVPSLAQMARTPLQIFVGDAALLPAYSPVLFALAFIALALLCLMSPRSRGVLLCGVALPFLACFLISTLAKPMWLPRNFVIAVPVFYLAVARFLESMPRSRSLARWAAAGLALILVANVLALPDHAQRRTPGYRAVVEAAARSIEERDCVAIESNLGVFWGFARYFGRESSINTLTVQGPPASDRWVDILNGLEAGSLRPLAQRAGLLATQSDLLIRNVYFSVGTTEPRWPREFCNRWLLVKELERREAVAAQIDADGVLLASEGRFALYRLLP